MGVMSRGRERAMASQPRAFGIWQAWDAEELTSAVEYEGAQVPVRKDLREAHRFILDHVRSPGTWWTGAERAAIAAEARGAARCARGSAAGRALASRSGGREGGRRLVADHRPRGRRRPRGRPVRRRRLRAEHRARLEPRPGRGAGAQTLDRRALRARGADSRPDLPSGPRRAA